MTLEDLNPSQREAVLYCDGPSLVIAGAGSGKTRVLTYKIAYLLEQGMAPWNILALTFTNKAANEMKQRVIQQVHGLREQRLWMGTFHSIFVRILRAECSQIRFSPNFTIYDTADSKSLIKSIIREMQLDDKIYKPNSVLSHISAAKNRLILPDAYLRDPQLQRADQASRIPATGQIYQRYWARCRQADAMDFDDILVYTYLLFHHFPEVRQRYEEHFEYILVDEYQDTNYAQHAIVWQLSQTRRRVCVVGDDAQSIYSFRGANIDNILTFQKLYEGARLFKLEQNYRSTQTIVGAANSLIRHNRGQIQKDVFSRKEVGQPIRIYQYFSDIEESAGVARKVMSLRKYDHVDWHDIAILYRTNAQSRSFEEAFRKQGIPYRVYGNVSFYQRKEIKDMIAYFRLSVNPNDEEALKRVINYPARGIGQTTLQRVIETSTQAGVSLWTVVSNPEAYLPKVSQATASKLKGFVNLINSFRTDVDRQNAAELGVRIAKESGVEADICRGREPEDIARQENLQELLDGMHQFVDERTEEEGGDRVLMTHYLQEVSLLSDLDESDEDGDDKLSLMTVHSAKGLEFRVVFVVGMEENLFPNQMSMNSVRELEEERRLFYVAITRAEEQCFLTYAQNRYRFGKSEFCTRSNFLNEIDSQYVEFNASSGASSRSSGASHSLFRSFESSSRSSGGFDRSSDLRPSSMPLRSLKRVSPSAGESGESAASAAVSSTQTAAGTLTVGSRIEHARFGCGTVTALSGTGIDAKATVQFDNVGTKQLLLRFAKFTIL